MHCNLACSFLHTKDDPYRSTDFSRGSRVLKMELLLLDEAKNKLDLGANEVSPQTTGRLGPRSSSEQQPNVEKAMTDMMYAFL